MSRTAFRSSVTDADFNRAMLDRSRLGLHSLHMNSKPRGTDLNQFRVILLSFAALLVASLWPAKAQSPPQSLARGGTLDFAVIGTPNTLDCHAANSFAVLHYIAPHYSLLVKFDPERFPEVKGDLAASWQVSADGLAYTFKLRPNIVFHNGSPLSSSDVKASFDRLRNPPAGVVSAAQALFTNIAAIDAPDPATVIFRLARPQSYFLAVVAYPFNCILSAALMAADPTYPAKSVMGSGPFEFIEHVPGSHWRAKRFDRYFIAERPLLDGFKAITFSQSSAVASALQSGQALAEFRSFSPPIRDRLKEAMGDKLTVHESIWALSISLSFNAERKPFDDARVRRALNLAIDRWSGAQICRKLLPSDASVRPSGRVRHGPQLTRSWCVCRVLGATSKPHEQRRGASSPKLATAA